MRVVTGIEIIEAARRWLNKPYRSQGRDEFGLDCGGLILVVAREIGASELEVLGYANAPDGEMFERLLDENADRIEPKENVQIGDILAFDYGDGIQHTAFVALTEPYLKVIHAKRGRGVIETRLFGTQDARAWVRTYRIKGARG